MTLYNGVGFYRAIMEAESKGACSRHLQRLVENVLRRKRLPIEVREQFVADAYELFTGLWGEEIPSSLSSCLNSYFLQDDNSGGLSGATKFAPCSKYEYSFFSHKKEVKALKGNYFKESAMNPVIENSQQYAVALASEEHLIWLDEVIAHSNLREDEEYVFRKSVIEGIPLREMAGYNGMSKSTLGRRLKLGRTKVIKAAKKYGGRG